MRTGFRPRGVNDSLTRHAWRIHRRRLQGGSIMRKNILIIGSNHRDAQPMSRCVSAICRELNTADFVVLNDADETQYLRDSSFDLIVADWNSARTADYLN